MTTNRCSSSTQDAGGSPPDSCTRSRTNAGGRHRNGSDVAATTTTTTAAEHDTTRVSLGSSSVHIRPPPIKLLGHDVGERPNILQTFGVLLRKSRLSSLTCHLKKNTKCIGTIYFNIPFDRARRADSDGIQHCTCPKRA